MNKLTHILVTVTFVFACFGLWAVLNVLGTLSAQSAQALPGFTKFVFGLRLWLLLLPIPVAAYGIYAVVRRHVAQQSGTMFVACAMSGLCLVFFPVLLALFLPCAVLMDQVLGR
ncbi:MAG: hypothetical protein AB9869_08105 [Verrucomicrobiia bacterium]